MATNQTTPPLRVWGLIVQSDARSVARLFVARSYLIATQDIHILATRGGVEIFDITAVRVECFGVADDPQTEEAKSKWVTACGAAGVRVLPQESP